MLHALLQNKARGEIKEDVNSEGEKYILKNVFKHNEDTATSFVFGCLRYLPQSLFLEIINKSCQLQLDTKSKIEDFHFWPRWKTENDESSVEPDVFIRSKSFDIIVEVKTLNDRNNQCSEQWERQIDGYCNEYGNDKKKLYYIALGGNKERNINQIKNVKVHTCSWDNLLNVIRREYKKPNEINIQFILDDLIEIFRLFDLEHFWLETMQQTKFKSNLTLIENF